MMEETPTSRNRLDSTASPYLQDHADNPVYWQPWDDSALAVAREHDVPIFLSIGYAACHWCHVMADESFEDDQVAAVLNRSFVPIKVDREERPDLDGFYQTAGRITGGGGGWPLSVWLTPDGRPFQVATYLPPRPKRGMPGFLNVLESIETAWQEDRSTIEARASEITEAVRNEGSRRGGDQATSTPDEPLTAVAGDLLRIVDQDHGGFESSGPKFPQVSRLQVLLRAWTLDGRDAYRHALERSLDAMVTGGLRDHVGRGFFRYVTDPRWEVPHFEKMAYDNALLVEVLAEAANRLNDDRYERAARDGIAFLTDELRLASGGICCSLDADTEGDEGATYVWTAEEVATAIDDATTRAIVTDHLGLDGGAEVSGGRVPRIATSREALADAYDRPTTAIDEHLDAGITQLKAARDRRPQPRRDDKAIAAWNGLAIRGLARAGVALDDPAPLDAAGEVLEFVDKTLREGDRLWRRYRDGAVGVTGFLDDYAAVADGAFALADATGSTRARRIGLEVTHLLLDHCWDPESERLRYAPAAVRGAPADPLDPTDRSMPSAVALATEALATASGFNEDGRLHEALDWIETTYAGGLEAGGVNQAALALGLDRWYHGPPSITIVGDDLTPTQRRSCCRHPRRPTITHRPTAASDGADALGVQAVPPLWRDRQAQLSPRTLYPCRGRVCGNGVSSVAEAIGWLNDG